MMEEMMMKVLKEMEGNKHREEERRLEEEARRKSEEERRLKERREDKEERMINAREMKEGVRKEMLEAMAPWQERTVRVEESTAVLGEEMKRMAEQMKEMKEKLVTRSERCFASVTEHGGRGPQSRERRERCSRTNSNLMDNFLPKSRIFHLHSARKLSIKVFIPEKKFCDRHRMSVIDTDCP